MESHRQESPGTALAGGTLLAAISNSIVAILRDHYGQGPMHAKTYAHDDLIVVVVRGLGLTPLEKTLLESGDPHRIVGLRHEFHRVMTEHYKQTIEELTGRTVVAFLSQAHVAPDITMETFFLDRPLDVYGAIEIADPG